TVEPLRTGFGAVDRWLLEKAATEAEYPEVRVRRRGIDNDFVRCWSQDLTKRYAGPTSGQSFAFGRLVPVSRRNRKRTGHFRISLQQLHRSRHAPENLTELRRYVSLLRHARKVDLVGKKGSRI